jgi:homocysteine S-methyltransferase
LNALAADRRRAINDGFQEVHFMTKFQDLLTNFPVVLGEGAVIERLRRTAGIALDAHVVNSALIYEAGGRAALEAIYRQYLDIGQRYQLPLLLSTPTWRAGRERIAAAGLAGRDLNGDNTRFLAGLRDSFGDYGQKVALCGLMSCRGDAYKPAEALSAAAAADFHAWQADALASAGVDFLLAATLPALSEALGLARAQAATGLPYVISFVARPEGTLLDGTPLEAAIATIDAGVTPRPLAYLINCTHASIFRSALLHERNSSPQVRARVIGLLANTAALSPEALDDSPALVEEAPETFGQSMAALQGELGMKVLGGCCGTDQRHIECLARALGAGRLVESPGACQQP